MTVTWHVDGLKISHMDSVEVTKCIKNFKEIYGNRMTIHRGKVHRYLGMDLDFSSPRVLKIGMIKYINSSPSMVTPVSPISNVYFTGENHCVLTFAR